MPEVWKLNVSNYGKNWVIIELTDGRIIELVIKDNSLSVRSEAGEFDLSQCEFVNFGYPSD